MKYCGTFSVRLIHYTQVIFRKLQNCLFCPLFPNSWRKKLGPGFFLVTFKMFRKLNFYFFGFIQNNNFHDFKIIIINIETFHSFKTYISSNLVNKAFLVKLNSYFRHSKKSEILFIQRQK